MTKLLKSTNVPYFQPDTIKTRDIKDIPISSLKNEDPRMKGIKLESMEQINDNANIRDEKTIVKYLDLFFIVIIIFLHFFKYI